jgi:hypothetical protein
MWPSDFLCFLCHRLIFYSLFVAFVVLYLLSSNFFGISLHYLCESDFLCFILDCLIFFLFGGIFLHYLCRFSLLYSWLSDFLFYVYCLNILYHTSRCCRLHCIWYLFFIRNYIYWIWHLWLEGLNSDTDVNSSININKIYFSPKIIEHK